MFKEKYRKSIDQIHAREGLLYRIIEQEKAPKKKKKHILPVALTATCSAAVATLCVIVALGGATAEKDASASEAALHEAFDSEGNETTAARGVAVSNGIRTADSLEEIYQALSDGQNRKDLLLMTEEVVEDAAIGKDTVSEWPAAEPYESAVPMAPDANIIGTNEQVQGVGEADLVKTDGEHLFVLSREQSKLFSVKTEDGTLTKLDAFDLPIDEEDVYWNVSEMFLHEDRLFLLGTRQEWNWEEDKNLVETVTLVVDCSDPSELSEQLRHTQSGRYETARMVDGYLYVVSEYSIGGHTWDPNDPITFLPIVDEKAMSYDRILLTEPCSETASRYTVVTSLFAAEPTVYTDEKALLGGSDTVYCNATHLVLTEQQHEYTRDESEKQDEQGRNYVQFVSETKTNVTVLTLKEGKITEKASKALDGMLHNSFSLDMQDGFLRLVLLEDRWTETIYTDGIDTYETESDQSTSLVILDESLQKVGELGELAEGETVRSVRFLEDVVYFVTFRQTDPLFAVDVSDPYQPTLLSELKITGFSAYLHPFGTGRLLGIGYEADADTGSITGVKLSLFDTSDPKNVTETHRFLLEGLWTDAEANHRSVFVDTERSFVGFSAENRYCFFRYDEDEGFTLLYEMETDWGEFRAVSIDDVLYCISSQAIESIDLNTFTRLDHLTLS